MGDILERLDRALLDIVFSLAWTGRQIPGNGQATGILHAFAWAERRLERGHEIHTVNDGGVLRYEITRLPRGTRPLPLHPGVKAGDRIIRLHFDNDVLASLFEEDESPRRIAWEVTRRTASDLITLAAMVRAGAFPSDIRALWAETVIYRALIRLGFQAREAKSSIRRPFARLYVLALMAIYGPPGLVGRSSDRLRHYQLGEAWIDLHDLVERYASESG